VPIVAEQQDHGARSLAAPARAPQTRDAGFTIIEIIAILIIMGIVSAYAVGRAVFTERELQVQTEVLKTHLRHAQSRAMSSNLFWGIQTDTGGDTYSLFRLNSDDTLTLIKLPGEDTTTVDLSAKGLSMTAGTYSFDSRGVPYLAGAADTPPGALQGTSDVSITLSSGAETTSVTITKNTGFIP
jgi:MSHA pilin protein MshC